jgi:hypothetical protein
MSRHVDSASERSSFSGSVCASGMTIRREAQEPRAKRAVQDYEKAREGEEASKNQHRAEEALRRPRTARARHEANGLDGPS